MEIIKYTESELEQVVCSLFTPDQLKRLLAQTPKKYIKERPAKGGGVWKYTPVGYTMKALNLLFGWDWSFEVVKEDVFIEAGEVVVKGRLTVKLGENTIVKEQYGNKDIIFRKDSKRPLSIGNDMKAAASDSLKKCASMIGIAADIYAPEQFNAVDVQLDERDIAKELSNCSNIAEMQEIWRSLSEKKQSDYKNLFDLIQKILK